MKQKSCGSCGHQNRNTNYYCTSCGATFYEGYDNYARLFLLQGEPTGAVFLLANNRRNTIGRDGSNTIILADEEISNKHAVIKYDKETYWIEDVGSKNGIFVDGLKIHKPFPLMNGCIIEMGSSALMVENQ